MTQQEFNSKVNTELGALRGIGEAVPACDKPCSTAKSQSHYTNILGHIAEYVGNGMSADIAARVTTGLQANKQVPTPVTIPWIKGSVLTLTKKAMADWSFRLIILPLIIYLLANGKIDRETVREVVADAVKAQREQVQPASKAAPTLENTVGMEKPQGN